MTAYRPARPFAAKFANTAYISALQELVPLQEQGREPPLNLQLWMGHPLCESP